MESKKRSTLTIVLFTLYILVLTGIILFKLPFYSELSAGIRVINIIPFQGSFDHNGVLNISEIIGNIILFIPLGVYISMLKSEWAFVRKVLPAICLSLLFEVLQYIFAIGRTDITDVLGNTLGAILGIGVYPLLFKLLKSRTIKIVNILALALTVYIITDFAYLISLSHLITGRPPFLY